MFIVGVLMPSLKATRLQFIQDIFAGNKKVLMQDEVPARYVPGWKELAVKDLYPQVVKIHPDILEYLPDP